jgi:tetratricopeptide (TPR) repeat protein
MHKLKVFLSSAMTGELKEERVAIKVLFNSNEKLNSFFELYAIDDHASPNSIQIAYTNEVQESKILICVLGEELRDAVVDEFITAKAKDLNIFCYIKERVPRSIELNEFIDKHAHQVPCGHFYETSELTNKIQNDLWKDIFNTYIRRMKSDEDFKQQNILTGTSSSPNNEYRFYSVDHLIKASQLEQISSLSNEQLIVFSIVSQEQYGDYRTALLLLEIALLRDPDDWKLHNNRGTVLDAMGLIEAGLYCYKKVLELNPTSHTALYNIANSLVTLGREKEALQYYENALALYPEKIVAINRIVTTYLRLGYPEKALQFSSKAIAQTDDIIVKANHAICLSANGLYDDAFDVINQLRGNDYYYHYVNAQVLFKVKKYEESISEIDSILNLGALDYELAIKKFYCLAALGKIEEVTTWINVIEKNYPFKAVDYNDIGYHLMHEMQLLEQSIPLFKKAVDQSSQMMIAWNNLQACLGELGNLSECLKACEDALSISPFDSKSIKNKYSVLIRMEKFEEASMFLFEKSFELVGTSESKGYANIFKDFVTQMAQIHKDSTKFKLDLGLSDDKK